MSLLVNIQPKNFGTKNYFGKQDPCFVNPFKCKFHFNLKIKLEKVFLIKKELFKDN